MAVFQCQICGSTLEIHDQPFVTCECCGTQQTLPKSGNSTALLDRGFMSLEDGEWDKADGFFEQYLNQHAKDAKAYLGKLMAELQVRQPSGLKDCKQPFDSNNNYQKVMRFADAELQTTLAGYIAHIQTRNEQDRLESIYNRACSLISAQGTENAFNEAAQLFESIPEYRDAATLAKDCHDKAELTRQETLRFKEEEVQRIAKQKKKNVITIASVACAVIVFILLLNTLIIPLINYHHAVALMDAGDKAEAAIAFGKSGDYRDAKEQSFQLWNDVAVRETISAGNVHTVGLKTDGTVVATGNNDRGQCNVTDWTDIVAVSAGGWHTVGLKADGTVVATGEDDSGQCNISGWADIVAISTGGWYTVGLKADGTVVATGENDSGQCNVSGWKDIVAIAAGHWHTVGLKADGTVVATGENEFGQCNVDGWTDIVSVSAGVSHTVALKADGTVVATGSNAAGQCDVTGWKDIVAVAAGSKHTVALKTDGTMVAIWSTYADRINAAVLTDLISISTSNDYAVGVKSDGTVVAIGLNEDGRCDVTGWTNIKTP